MATNPGEIIQEIERGIADNEQEQQTLGTVTESLGDAAGPAAQAAEQMGEVASTQAGVENDVIRAQGRAAEIVEAVGQLVTALSGIDSEVSEVMRRTIVIQTKASSAAGRLFLASESAKAAQTRLNQAEQQAEQADTIYIEALSHREDERLILVSREHVSSYGQNKTGMNTIATVAENASKRAGGIIANANTQAEGFGPVRNLIGEILNAVGPLDGKAKELQAALGRQKSMAQDLTAVIEEPKTAAEALPGAINAMTNNIADLTGESANVVMEARQRQQQI